ncbi:MAG: thioredoxin domain-containing protein [bacterium]
MSKSQNNNDYLILDDQIVRKYLTPFAIVISGIFIALSLVIGSNMNRTTQVDASGCSSSDNRLSEGCLIKYATDLKLNKEKFSSCLKSKKFDDKIAADLNNGSEMGIDGTPTLFLAKEEDGKLQGFYIGATMPYDTLSSVLDYATTNDLKTTLQYWKDQQNNDLENLKIEANDYYQSSEGGSLTGDALQQAVDKILVQRQQQNETKYVIKDMLIKDSFSIGNGKVILVEFSDYECPYCKQFAQDTLVKVKKEYVDKGKVKFVFKDFPLEKLHASARLAANAARCAGDQKQYFEYYDVLFEIK